MQLSAFSVSKYRSIRSAKRLEIQKRTTLIGPNNEGKSNLLSAIATSIELIRSHASARRRSSIAFKNIYTWERDFPVELQEKQPSGETVFRIEFTLNEKEIAEFKKEIKSTIDGTLPVQITIGSAGLPKFKVVKHGRGANSLSQKGPLVADFIGSRFSFTYIPAVRQEQDTFRIVEKMVANELRVLEDDPNYKAAITAIAKMQTPILNGLSKKIGLAMRHFLPQVASVKINISENERYRALRTNCEIIVDDGTATPLSQKGDGVKSLAAISLMRAASGLANESSLLAIEEPESHLHPAAARALQDAIDDLAAAQQVILTTHSPLFTDRRNIEANILVRDNAAEPATSIDEIRRTLGVIASDNLQNANFVLVVEGMTDKRSLDAVIPQMSERLRDAMAEHMLVIDHLGGGGKLSYKLSLIQQAVCVPHVFFDYDASGKASVNSALEGGLLKPAEYTYCRCQGMRESEFEDIIDQSIYSDYIRQNFRVLLDHDAFRRPGKWCQRMSNLFAAHGLDFEEHEVEVKKAISKLVEQNPTRAIARHRRSVLTALIDKLEAIIGEGRG
ncbi:ATP-dependent nuclease [Burkholderia pseudomallei]|uniref:ATP-dependent nuclease n=1 Tax=Burkholderia pseudomallei TaxID=28450 RepID=UPI0003F99790|nr:ATP-binding protein [Burkholderia pseudomallei]KGS78612.1 AAA domain protein [Burkholderia pseudomallei MSHR5596]KGW92912.1 AAA ATPase domain protein [Burkholderia pseudomallei MSHR456]MBM5592592.1 AAA family ATPase [Burkholderia pseudomallei]